MKTYVKLIFKYIGIITVVMLLVMCEVGGATGGIDAVDGTIIDVNTYTLSYETIEKGTATAKLTITHTPTTSSSDTKAKPHWLMQ